MNVDDAAYAVVHDYPGGADALAARMSKSAAVLRSKVKQTCDTHHLTLREAVTISVLSCDVRIFKAAATELDHVLLPLPSPDDQAASDMAVLELMASVWAGQGDLGSAIHSALSDGKVTQQELAKVRAVASAAQTRIAALVRRFESLAEPVRGQA